VGNQHLIEKFKYNCKYNYIGDIIMTEVVVTARKWGNSIGITLPKSMAEKEKIKDSDKLVVSVKKIVPIKELFGTFKTNKTAQELKNEMREGWD